MSLPKRILVVDDEPNLRATLAATIELDGFEVIEARDAAEALAITAAQRFDLVLTDIRRSMRCAERARNRGRPVARVRFRP
jgi:DNA-binding response OmpR family regulator